MENNSRYLIPANTKKGQLLFGIFKPFDLGIFVTGVIITFILLLLFSDSIEVWWIAVICVLPAVFAILLVFPIPNYHNVRVLIGEVINFYSENRTYKWRGWCAVYEFERKQQK